MSRILLVTAVTAEADAVCAGMMGSWQPRATAPGVPAASGASGTGTPSRGSAPSWDRQLLTAVRIGPYLGRRSGAVTVLAAGAAGPAAAAGTATALATAHAAGDPFDLIVSFGVAGGFAGRANVGDLVVADALIAADLGAESGVDTSPGEPAQSPAPSASSDFLTLEQLGLGASMLTPREDAVQALVDVLSGTGRAVRTGPVLTVSTVTGTDRRAGALALRFGPAAEAMEGYAVATAAAAYGTPFAEIRAISNAVGRRDRSSWDLPGALAGLSAAAAALTAGIDTLTAAVRTSGSAGRAEPAGTS
ncbi:futalosine hydrolase [Protofrankia symbiont of Coriaria ruscifolia]|uniref:Futalosine hydrolase n=1 Tax=Candidatus Protofrankia californiensis TaxID=1839754 RepID=A0A1C3NT66_9ACTN|nr:futalosine hydrolase [Protofrankia symbiont of Coriaria ruscifolia]SBW17335.1 futalosine nucleosidase [Candidatus Protofrankia californiensis]